MHSVIESNDTDPWVHLHVEQSLAMLTARSSSRLIPHLNRHIRKEDSHGLSVPRCPLVIGGKKQWAGLFIALPRSRIEARESLSGTVVDEFLESLVFANVEFPGVAGRVAALRRVFHHDSSRGLLTDRHLLHALVGHSRPVQSNAVVTAGAALSHLDLALALIRRASPELANLTAKYLVVDARTSQSIYSIPDHLAHADPLVRQFERWARRHLAEGFSLDQAAVALTTSKRTLARRMQSVLGKSPLAYFQELRMERAVHLLMTSDASVDQIAAEVGYAEGVTLRALLRRRLGHGVREIRRSL